MDKIRVLLIDDQPGFAFKSGELYPIMKDDSEHRNMPELTQHFDIQWLQSAKDTKEFRDSCIEIENSHSPKKLGELRIIPEIVCFDYALSGSERINIPTNREFLDALMPNFRVCSFLNRTPWRLSNNRAIDLEITREVQRLVAEEEGKKATEGIKLSDDELDDLEKRFNTELKNKSKQQTISEPPAIQLHTSSKNTTNLDNMGCFSGGMLVSQFKAHPCSAVPTTRKGESDLKGTEAYYFEWLLDYEFEGAFEYRGRQDPKWSDLITLAVKNLRTKIQKLAQSGRIQLSLENLMSLVAPQLPDDEKVLTFWSIYGRRDLPLDGLFVDIPPSVREAEIRRFADNLLKSILGTFPFGDVQNAIEKTEWLWQAYSGYGSDDFYQRILLSDLYARNSSATRTGKGLNKTELDKLSSLMIYFDVKEDDGISYQIQKEKIVELRELLKGKDFSLQSRRLIVFFAIVRLLQRYHLFIEKYNGSLDKDDKKTHSKYTRTPDDDDLLFVLFPIPRNPIVLPLHQNLLKEGEDGWKKDAKSNFTKCLRDLKIEINVKTLDPSVSMDAGEKRIVLNYILGQSKANQTSFIPEWLKNI